MSPPESRADCNSAFSEGSLTFFSRSVFSISENNIYIADNIGFIYSIDISNGNVLWIKNYAVPIKSNMKIFNNKIFLIDQDNKILCFSTKDGSLIWDFLSISSFIKSQNLLSLVQPLQE